MSEDIRILFLAAEAAPLIKVGGLGDVAGSLPPALRKLQRTRPLDVRLVIPFHGDLQQRVPNLEQAADFLIPTSRGAVQAQAYITHVDDLPVYLIGGPDISPSEPVYGPDNEQTGRKFVFFSLAALEMVRAVTWKPHILHANDWHTALSIYGLARQRSRDDFFNGTRTVLSVHNLPFMGDGAVSSLEDFHISPSQNKKLPAWARVFPLPLGLLTTDRIVAVSPTYAQDIQTPEFGCGLQEFLAERSPDLSGILNGIDQHEWDPTTDPVIEQPFSPDRLELRQSNKTALQAEFGLPVQPETPLLIFISRMDQQKGVDIAVEGLRLIDHLDWQAIFLGTGSAVLESAVRSLEVEYPDRVRAAIRFDGALARRMYAGGDILLMPSRYEPCGLAQMIAMRYGCLPLARATGGLKDTIADLDNSERGSGFLFTTASPLDLSQTVERAILHYQSKDRWQVAQLCGMQTDFSWTRSASSYAQLYEDLLNPSDLPGQ